MACAVKGHVLLYPGILRPFRQSLLYDGNGTRQAEDRFVTVLRFTEKAEGIFGKRHVDDLLRLEHPDPYITGGIVWCCQHLVPCERADVAETQTCKTGEQECLFQFPVIARGSHHSFQFIDGEIDPCAFLLVEAFLGGQQGHGVALDDAVTQCRVQCGCKHGLCL